MVFLLALLTWFCFGFAAAFGTDPEAAYPAFFGFRHGWFGDLEGGLSTDGENPVP